MSKNAGSIDRDVFRIGLRTILTASMGSDYAGYLVDDERFFNDVVENVEETSALIDEGYYTTSDIKLAIGRIILEKFGIEY